MAGDSFSCGRVGLRRRRLAFGRDAGRPWADATAAAARILKTAFGLGFLSMTLTYVYGVILLWLLVLPLYLSILLNDYFYDWTYRLLSRALGAERRRVLAGLSLGGELALFGVLIYGLSEAIKLV